VEPRTWPSADGVALAAWGNLVVQVLVGKTVPAGLDRIVAAADEVLAEHGPFVNFTVIPSGQSMPDKEYRAYSSEVLKARTHTTRINVLVLEGKGFWLATARMVLSAMERLSDHPLEVEETLDQGFERVKTMIEGVDDIDALLPALNAWVDSVRPTKR
jgi:hypothetical protein